MKIKNRKKSKIRIVMKTDTFSKSQGNSENKEQEKSEGDENN
jgi:hypothetical protein